uniref:uncharacterized protein n=1 Tax=Myxine glutinosa TaxID=7769 RepID=UPI00358F7BEC
MSVAANVNLDRSLRVFITVFCLSTLVDAVYDVTYGVEVYGFTGGTVMLPCTLRYEPKQVGSVFPTGEWFIKSTSYYTQDVSIDSLSSTNRFTFKRTRMNNNCSLTITNLIKSDTGTYYFKLKEPREQSWESGIRVEVYVYDVTYGVEVYGFTGGTVVLPCTLRYKPKQVGSVFPTGEWFIKSTLYYTQDVSIDSLSSTNRFTFKRTRMNNNCSLTITNLIKSDTGTYYFKLKEPREQSWESGIRVEVYVYDVTYGVKVYGFTGGTVMLPCTLWYDPKQVGSVFPTGEWFIKSTSYNTQDVSIDSLSSTNRFTFKRTRMNNNCSLTITNLIKSDTGTYYFKLKEPREQSWESGIRVYVYDKPQKPTVTTKGSFTLGQSLTMLCETESNPPSTISWYKDYKWGRIGKCPKERNTCSHELNPLQWEHAGDYYCVARNTDGDHDSPKFTLTLYDVTYGVEVYGFTGGTVMLPCTLRYEPKQVGSVFPTGEWFIKSTSYYTQDVSIDSLSSTNRFTFKRTRMHNNCSLTITNLIKSDTGTYYFKLKESREQSWESGIRVEVHDLPTSRFVPEIPVDGETVTFSCAVQSHFNLHLYARCSAIGTKEVQRDGVRTTANLVFTASTSNNGASCYCDMEFGGKIFKSGTRTLDVQYLPTSRFVPEIPVDGETVTFFCAVQSHFNLHLYARCSAIGTKEVQTDRVRSTANLVFTASTSNNGASCYCDMEFGGKIFKSGTRTLDVQYNRTKHLAWLGIPFGVIFLLLLIAGGMFVWRKQKHKKINERGTSSAHQESVSSMNQEYQLSNNVTTVYSTLSPVIERERHSSNYMTPTQNTIYANAGCQRKALLPLGNAVSGSGVGSSYNRNTTPAQVGPTAIYAVAKPTKTTEPKGCIYSLAKMPVVQMPSSSADEEVKASPEKHIYAEVNKKGKKSNNLNLKVISALGKTDVNPVQSQTSNSSGTAKEIPIYTEVNIVKKGQRGKHPQVEKNEYDLPRSDRQAQGQWHAGSSSVDEMVYADVEFTNI